MARRDPVRAPFLGSSERVGVFPATPKKKITLIAIGTSTALHLGSLLNDRCQVVEAFFVDLFDEQLWWIRRMMETMARCDDRWDYMDEVFGVKFDRSQSTPDWRHADLSRMEETCRVKFMDPPLHDDGSPTLWMWAGCYGPQKSPLRVPAASHSGRWVGWNWGYLLDGAYPFRVPRTEYVQGSLADVGDALIKRAAGDEIVIWLSNAVGWFIDGLGDKRLDAAVKRWDKNPRVRLSMCASYASKWRHVYSKSHIYLPKLKTPHAYYVDEVLLWRRPGQLYSVFPSPRKPVEKSPKIPNWTMAGRDRFMRGEVKDGATVVTHMMRLAGDSALHDVANEALAQGSQVMVLEHNRWTEDRENMHNEGATAQEIQEIVGRKAARFRWCLGRGDLRRNMLAIFEP